MSQIRGAKTLSFQSPDKQDADALDGREIVLDGKAFLVMRSSEGFNLLPLKAEKKGSLVDVKA